MLLILSRWTTKKKKRTKRMKMYFVLFKYFSRPKLKFRLNLLVLLALSYLICEIKRKKILAFSFLRRWAKKKREHGKPSYNFHILSLIVFLFCFVLQSCKNVAFFLFPFEVQELFWMRVWLFKKKSVQLIRKTLASL